MKEREEFLNLKREVRGVKGYKNFRTLSERVRNYNGMGKEDMVKELDKANKNRIAEQNFTRLLNQYKQQGLQDGQEGL